MAKTASKTIVIILIVYIVMIINIESNNFIFTYALIRISDLDHIEFTGSPDMSKDFFKNLTSSIKTMELIP